MLPEIDQIYGNRVRLRVCGLLHSGDRLLMINHRSLAPGAFWAPPGGGVEFGESLRTSLEREFLEETGLIVRAEEFRFLSEFVRPPLHGVELFFTVTELGGRLKTGSDPEMKPDEQLIESVGFLSWNAIAALPPDARHGVFNSIDFPAKILDLRGHVTF